MIQCLNLIDNETFIENRPLAKVPNTPPPAPLRLRGGVLFLIYARSLMYIFY